MSTPHGVVAVGTVPRSVECRGMLTQSIIGTAPRSVNSPQSGSCRYCTVECCVPRSVDSMHYRYCTVESECRVPRSVDSTHYRYCTVECRVPRSVDIMQYRCCTEECQLPGGVEPVGKAPWSVVCCGLLTQRIIGAASRSVESVKSPDI